MTQSFTKFAINDWPAVGLATGCVAVWLCCFMAVCMFYCVTGCLFSCLAVWLCDYGAVQLYGSLALWLCVAVRLCGCVAA